MKNKIYVGLIACKPSQVFRSNTEPTTESHGNTFNAVIGPFKTIRGATWMADPIRGKSNPHCRNVADAERLAKKYKNEYNPNTQTWNSLPL